MFIGILYYFIILLIYLSLIQYFDIISIYLRVLLGVIYSLLFSIDLGGRGGPVGFGLRAFALSRALGYVVRILPTN